MTVTKDIAARLDSLDDHLHQQDPPTVSIVVDGDDGRRTIRGDPRTARFRFRLIPIPAKDGE